MSGEYVEGALYEGRVFGGGLEAVVFIHDDPWPWMRINPEGDVRKAQRLVRASDVTDITGPLRVLNPDERVVETGQVVLDLDEIRSAFRVRSGEGGDLLNYLRDDGYGFIADAIAEQTKPPRIPEPGNFGDRVVAAHKQTPSERRLWIRSFVNPAIGSQPWTDGDHLATWDDLLDPEVES